MSPIDDDWIDLAEHEHRIGWRDRLDAMPCGWRTVAAAFLALYGAAVALATWWAGWLL